MLFTCDVQELLDGLSTASRALSSRPAKQILEGVLLETTESGIRITCTDLNLTIETYVDATVKEEGQVVLPGRLFTDLVRKLSGGLLEINVDDKNIAYLRNAGSTIKLSGLSAREYPRMDEPDTHKSVTLPQSKMRDMINKVSFAVATDETRLILTGILLEITQSEVRLVALDGFRLAMRRLSGTYADVAAGETIETVVPGKVMSELAKLLSTDDTPLTISFSESRMELSFGKTKMYNVLLAGEYIRYRQIMPTTWTSRATIKTREFERAIERASLMAREGKNNLIKMHMTQEGLVITSNAELGDVHEKLDLLLEGRDIDIAFNVRYLSDVLRNIDEETVCMRFTSNVSPSVVCPAEWEDYLYLVLPVRVFE
ncbi:MAG: DNA polymerase III subunit beta [Eubacteriales bacterium]|nr:DNA polymerase III subunit beta [Eubacteriales bacterium]MDD3881107.1 DNA polymerase III subunit beta [Eubacteriales bacterium]MDD4511489.1 DNA polymerase III subunit beta [Eubacteriales bacterium]